MIDAHHPTDRDRLAAQAALKFGLLRPYWSGLGYVSPKLCGLSGRDLEHAAMVAKHTLARWPQVATAAYRLLAADQERSR